MMPEQNIESASEDDWLLPFRIVFFSMIVLGVMINFKLFRHVQKEKTGERGRVFQRIMKNFALFQAICWPLVLVPATVLVHELTEKNFQDIFSACSYVYALHAFKFSYFLLRTYVGFNSLILALGRYIFVAHDNHVLRLGVERVARALISMSMIIPFIMTIWTDSVLTFEYKGWLSHIREFEISCSMSAKDDIKFNGSDTVSLNSFRSPIYTISHSIFPEWVSNGSYILFIIVSTLLQSNICEGIIYVKLAMFVFKSENKETILASLSENAKRLRRRRNIIGIQVTALAWMVELLGGAIQVSRYLISQTQRGSGYIDRILTFCDVFICMVPIPLTYLLNDETIKLMILAKGWTKFIFRRNER